ncbi:GNAT family N-acetyltransferase [Falsibacillus pallidus]|uniref:Ribosomal protein S18 acetylase RimI-like enzyme n=1 Tax=Falsibacillus pallidus TaxID=493781 RepID=A0A370GPM5_9BACI|nr:GNAT family N-acetyltransferase [Falsibacillus pallidus]RDI45637.1 ribosomal protein S18 acetylase RimI-like enzyme [Falsibacillus pallidus]
MSIVIREGTLNDAEVLLSIQKTVVSEGKYLIALSHEFSKTVDQQKEWIEGILQNERDTLLVAEKEGEVAGCIVFQTNSGRERTAHKGDFGLFLSPEYRGLGLGRMLLEELLDWAEKNPYIEKVCLGVFSINERAISLYKKLGFLEEGRKVREFKFGDDEYVDDILMYKWVKE